MHLAECAGQYTGNEPMVLLDFCWYDNYDKRKLQKIVRKPPLYYGVMYCQFWAKVWLRYFLIDIYAKVNLSYAITFLNSFGAFFCLLNFAQTKLELCYELQEMTCIGCVWYWRCYVLFLQMHFHSLPCHAHVCYYHVVQSIITIAKNVHGSLAY